MSELAVFRDLVRAHRRDVGRSQQQLAAELGLHPNVLSHKLNGHGRAVLTTPEVIGIVTALAQWGALGSRSSVEELLAAAGVPAHAVPATAWDTPPLSLLPEGSATSPLPRPRKAEERTLGGWRLTPPPAPLTRLVGRDDERRQVAQALRASRLVTLVGVGGTGKTRLAVQVAADVAGHYPDGVGFVDLVPVSDASLLPSAIATACGLAPRAHDEEEVLVDALSGRRMLLVVDNVEHVVEGAPVLSRLLEAIPGLQVLATSRVALRLYGEHIVRVPPLALTSSLGSAAPSDAVRLFLERTAAAGQHFSGTPEDLELVAAICAAVDGLPLAIELAVAKTRAYPPEDLLSLLKARAPVLDDGPRDAPLRHRALRATLDWSFDLLSPASRRALACLGVFAGPFDVAAAAAVSGTPVGFEERLGELSDHSLLEPRPGSPRRFALLKPIRDYALSRLAESGEQDDVERRSLTHHLEMAHRLLGRTTAENLDAVESAYPNIRGALDHGVRRGADDPDRLRDALLLANRMGRYWWTRGPIADGLRYLQRLLDVDPESVDPALRARTLQNLCSFASFAGLYELGAAYGRESIALFESLGDLEGLAMSYRTAGEAVYAVGELDTAETMFQEGYQISRERGDRFMEGNLANMLGQLLTHRGAPDEARSVLCAALEHDLVVGHLPTTTMTVHSLTEALRDLGDTHSAGGLLHAVLRISVDIGDSRMLAHGLEGMAALAGLEGDHDEALRRLGVARAIRERIGAELAPVEEATLRRAMSATYDATTDSERQAWFAAARSVVPEDLVAELLAETTVLVRAGSHDEIGDWFARVVAARGDVRRA